jgi:hypothetical protein
VSLHLRGLGWRDVGLARFRDWRSTFLYGTLAGIAMSALELFVTQPVLVWLTGQYPNLEDFRPLIGNPLLLLVLLVLAWLLAGFGEEMVYRGYVMNRVADLGNRTRAAWIASLVLVSVLFALAHTYQGITGVLEVLVAALVLGALYLATGRNLAVPVFAHGLADTIDFILIYLDKYPGM